MANPEHVELVKKGRAAIAEWRVGNPGQVLDLATADLVFQKGTAAHPRWSSADLRGADLSGADLRGTDLAGADLSGADLRDADLRRAVLRLANLAGAFLARADLRGAILPGANLAGANLGRAKLGGANLVDANLASADLSGADLNDSNTRGASLEAVTVDSHTKAGVSDSRGCTIDRYTLEAFDRFGGWKDTIDKFDLVIVDGLGRLRASFSGFWQWVHLIALTVFVFPYAFFLVWHWPGSEPVRPQKGEWTTLGQGLWNYIRSGGQGASHELSTDWWALCLFWFLVLYNGLRAVLLVKTKMLELDQEATGLPARFSLRHRIWKRLPVTWGHFYAGVFWGFLVNLLVVAIHTVLFLGHWIEVD